MSPTTEEFLSVALTLSEGDRLELADALMASLEAEDQPPFDDSWRAVIRRRSAELRSGKVKPVPWEEVKRRARERASG